MGIGKMTKQLPRRSKEFPMLEGVCGRRCRRIWHGAQCRHRLCLFAMASNFILLCDLLSLLCAAPPLLFSPLQCVSLRSWLGSARLWCPDVLLFWCPCPAKRVLLSPVWEPVAEFNGSLCRVRLPGASLPALKPRNVSLCALFAFPGLWLWLRFSAHHPPDG